MRTLSDRETRLVAGADMFGNAMIRVGTQLVAEGKSVNALPGGSTIGPGLERAGRQFIDAGQRHNDTTGGGPPGGGPQGG